MNKYEEAKKPEGFWVYSVIEYGGEWEDYYERIIINTIDAEKAQTKQRQLEKEFEEAKKQYEKCSNCPLYYDTKLLDDANIKTPDNLREIMKSYCNNFKSNDDEEKIEDLLISKDYDMINCIFDDGYIGKTSYKVKNLWVEI